jgi:hypothetical protein
LSWLNKSEKKALNKISKNMSGDGTMRVKLNLGLKFNLG